MKSFQTLSFINIQVYPHELSTEPLFHNKKPEAKYPFCSRQSTPIYLTISIGHK